MENTFINVRSTKDIVVFSSFLVSGCILMILQLGTIANFLGCILIFMGIVLAPILKSGYRNMITGDKFKKKEHYFPKSSYNSLISLISSDPESINVDDINKGNALRLDVYYAQKSPKAYVQLFEYVPYSYLPCTQLCEHEINNVKKLI